MNKTGVKTPAQDWSTRVTLTVTEAAVVLGIGRSAAYEAVHAGQIPHVRIGRRLLIPVGQLLAMLGDGKR